jgi:FtsH-binding integral membrane protein
MSRARIVVIILALVAMVALGESFGYYRSVTGVLMFLGILIFGTRYVRTMGDIPPGAEVTDISEYGLKYVCGNCGLELKVEKAARDKAPTHCMEPMNLVREGGKPPLRPV